jgi:hypothetical protein
VFGEDHVEDQPVKGRAVHLEVAYGVTAIENEVCRDIFEDQTLCYCITDRLV